MQKDKIAIVGDKDIILVFKAIGIDVFPVLSASEAETIIKDIAKDYALIYITENYAKELDILLQRYESRPYPIIVPIPSVDGSIGYGMQKIKDNVEKAVGINILED